MESFDKDTAPIRPATAAFIVFLIVLSACYIYQIVSARIRNRHLQSELNCLPPRKFPQKPLFGLDSAWISLKASKGHHLLETSRRRFYEVGAKTFSIKVLGRTLVYTIEPENLKAMLATSFNDWALPSLRKQAFAPVIGDGIFTLDDQA